MDQTAVLYKWPETYRPDAWQLPAYKKYDYAAGELRNLYISWKEIQDAADAGAEPPMWSVYCDVLHFEQEATVDRTAVIFARRIEVPGDLSIVLDRSSDEGISLILYAQEVVNYNTGRPAVLTIVEIGPEERQESVNWYRGEGGATGLTWMAGNQSATGDAVVMRPDKDLLIEGEPLRLLLTTTFQVATLFSTTKPALCLGQLHWIQALAAANPETMDLSLQAGALANTLILQKDAGSNALLVPFLDSGVYAESAKNLMTLLRQRDNKWTAFRNLKRADEQWRQVIEDSIGDKADQAELTRQLEKQAQDSLKQAWMARSIAARLVIEQKSSLKACQDDFEVAIKHWALDKSLQEGLNIVMGIFNILKEIPVILAGGPAFVAVDILPAANGLISGLAGIAGTMKNTLDNAGRNPGPGNNSGSPVVDSADDIDDLNGTLFNDHYMNSLPEEGDIYDLDGTLFNDDFMNNLAGGGPQPAEKPVNGLNKKAVKKLIADEKQAKAERAKASEAFKKSIVNAGGEAADVVNAALRIMQIEGQAAAMEATSARILASISKTVDESLSSTEVKGLDTVTGGSQEWDLLGLEIEQLFIKIKELEAIKGGADYRLQFRKLIVKGKALSETRLAVAKAGFQLAEMKLRTITAERSMNRSKQRMVKLEAQMMSDESLQQYAFNKVLDAKRAVYMALESYRRAFMYFTLTDGTEMQLPSLLDSVDSFEKAVSTIAGKELTLTGAFKTQTPQTINKQIRIDDAQSLADLVQKGLITWTLRYNDDHFKNLARIRFNQVSVFVEFKDGYRYDKEISVRVLTSGRYSDKNRHKGEKLFIGPPIQKNFEYTEVEGKQDVSVYANIAPRFVSDFFNPTPFTDWTISFNEAGFDKEQVKGLKVVFAGDALSV